MHIRGSLLAALVAALAIPAAASADTTLGITTQPSGSTPQTCPAGSPGPPANELLIAFSSGGGGPTGPLSVPSSPAPLAVSHWAVNAHGVTAPEQVTLTVVRINFSGPPAITIVGTDTETVTAPASPAADVENFTVAHPIQVQAGDFIGQYAVGASTGLTCYWSSIPSNSDAVEGLVLASPPTAGQTVTPSGPGVTSSASDLNLSATLSPLTYDAGVALSAAPSNAVAGQPAVLTATVTNHGPLGGPVTLTDPVPAGLKVDYAAASDGSCSTSPVNIVTCDLPNLASGQTAKVAVVVTPTAAHSYADSAAVSLTGGGNDPNAANNSATTTLKVAAPGAPTACVVPKLHGVSLGLAKKLLSLLGCKVGKVKRAQSKSVPKGAVISTNPRAGKYAVGRKIAITVSSGKPRKKH
jgi:hypothetical protein